MQVTIVDSTPGLLVNKKRVEGVRYYRKLIEVNINLINSEQSSGHAYCKSSGEQGSLLVGQFSPRKISSETVDHFSGGLSSFFLFKQ